jgi:hypothetical protein
MIDESTYAKRRGVILKGTNGHDRLLLWR